MIDRDAAADGLPLTSRAQAERKLVHMIAREVYEEIFFHVEQPRSRIDGRES